VIGNRTKEMLKEREKEQRQLLWAFDYDKRESEQVAPKPDAESP
jgi:hypothetical protein